MEVGPRKVTANKILLVASRLFAEKGFANVSIRDVCRVAGTTAPVIYYHFGSKKGLFDAVAKSEITMRDFIGELSELAAMKEAPKGLAAFIRTYLSSFPEHAFDPGLYMRDSATLDRGSARLISGDLDKIRSLAAGVIDRCIREGTFRSTDSGLAADCLLGMLNKVIFQHAHFSKASDKDAYGRFVTDFFFRAMK